MNPVPIPAFEEITDRILDAARDVVEDMYAENAKNYVGLDTNPIQGMNVARDKSNILVYKKDGTTYTLSVGKYKIRMTHDGVCDDKSIE